MKNLIIWALILGGVAYGGSKFYLHHKVEKGLDSAIVMMSPYADLTYDGVSSTMAGKLTVDGLRVRIDGFQDEIFVDRFGIDTPSFLALLEFADIAGGGLSSGGEFPEYIGLILEGMHIPSSADYYQTFYNLGIEALGTPADISEPGVQCVGKYGYSPAALVDLGYNEQVLSFAMYLRDFESGGLMNVTASIEEMWDFELDLKLAQGEKGGLMMNPMASRRLSELKFILTDRSINERVNNYCEQLGLSQEETLQAQLDALSFHGETNGIAFDEYIIEPYKEYLAGKPTLLVTAKPTNPVNLTQIDLYKPSDVPALLNLSATAQ